VSWSKSDLARLKSLLRNNNLLATEIAEQLGKSPQVTRLKIRELGISPRIRANRSGRLGSWNAKHSHLRARAMRYFLTHTFAETMKHFKLSSSELKSLQTVSYRLPEFAGLRKDRRRHDVWTFKETMFLLRHAGLQPRTWIAAKLKRGGMDAVKEMTHRLKSNTRYINGLPRRLAEELLGHEVGGFKVKAGPTGAGVDCRPIIVPWVILYSEARGSPSIPQHIHDALRAMSRFQKRIHGTRGINDTLASIRRSIGGQICLR